MVKIIPVMDVMKGVVVHAIAGERSTYRPFMNSTIASTPRPYDVLNGFRSLGCDTVYIADLDAIIGEGSNRDVIELALSQGFSVFADVGRRGFEEKDRPSLSYVIGSEYTVYPDELRYLDERVVSIDIKADRALFQNTALNVLDAARAICERNVKTVLVIFLNHVGTQNGIDIDLARGIVEICKGIDIAVGGGLREVKELYMLKNIGVKYALVATAIHKGIIDRCYY